MKTLKRHTEHILYKRQGFTYNTYAAYHKFINKHHKKLGECEVCNSYPVKTEWALIKGREYSKDINDYKEMCIPCHRKYDVTDNYRDRVSKRMKEGYSAGKYKSNLPCVKGKFGGLNPSSKKISQYDINGRLIKEFDSLSDASRELNVLVSSICNNAKGLSKTCNGFKFKYND